MEFMVRMQVRLPHDLAADERARLVAAERDYSQDLQRRRKIARIWRVSGQFANYCLFDVDTHEELHALISGLPMFGFIETQVEA